MNNRIFYIFFLFLADHESFQECIPEFYDTQAPVTGEYPIFLTPSTATVATSESQSQKKIKERNL